MILKLLALEILRKHGIESEERHLIAAEIESDYNDAINEMLIELGPKEKNAIQLDPEFLVDQEIRKIEDDFPLWESAHKEPVDVSSPSAGLLSPSTSPGKKI